MKLTPLQIGFLAQHVGKVLAKHPMPNYSDSRDEPAGKLEDMPAEPWEAALSYLIDRDVHLPSYGVCMSDERTAALLDVLVDYLDPAERK